MLKKILYFIWFVLFSIAVFFSLKNTNFNSFIDIIENRTFDLRQNIMINANSKVPNKDIVIVAIDEATYEYILDHYGEWPLPRDIYVKLVEYLESQKNKDDKTVKGDKKEDSDLNKNSISNKDDTSDLLIKTVE